MSFLDATGLGTFWAKLKNYFVPAANTVAPVTGLTNILSPVNLLPNSNFSRTNGLADTLTPNVSTTSVLSTPVTRNINLIIHNSSTFQQFADITITRSKNSITISGTANSAGSSAYFLVGIIEAHYVSNSEVTVGCKVKSLTNVEYTSQGQNLSHTTVYSDDWKNVPGTVVCVEIPKTGSGSYSPFYFKAIAAGSFSVTVEYIFAYKGSYKNPPYFEGLDVLTNNQFALAGSGISSLYAVNTNRPNAVRPGWNRLIKLYNSTTSGKPVTIKFFGEITWNGLHPVEMDCQLRYYCDGAINTFKMWAEVVQTYYMKQATAMAMTNGISKYRFATDGTDVYFECYVKPNYSSNIYLTVTDYAIGNNHANIPEMDMIYVSSGNTASGANDTLIGSEIGYRLLGSYTIVNPS